MVKHLKKCILADVKMHWRGGSAIPSYALQQERTVAFPQSICSGLILQNKLESIINAALDLHTKLMSRCPNPSFNLDNTLRPALHFSHQLKGILISEMFKFRANDAMI